MFRLSSTSMRRMNGVDHRWEEIVELALQISPIDFGIPEYGGMRTPEIQNFLYTTGRSQLDGYKKESYHQTGKALDFFAFVDGKASWKKEHLAIVAAAMLQAAGHLGHSLEWGGLWRSFKDYPHMQFKRGE